VIKLTDITRSFVEDGREFEVQRGRGRQVLHGDGGA